MRVGWNAEQEQGSYRRLQASALAAGESSAPAPITAGVCSGGDAETGGNDRVKAGEALMRAAPRHGTVGLDAFQLQAPDPQRGSSGITVHDTKGQQFFTEEEERCNSIFLVLVEIRWDFYFKYFAGMGKCVGGFCTVDSPRVLCTDFSIPYWYSDSFLPYLEGVLIV